MYGLELAKSNRVSSSVFSGSWYCKIIWFFLAQVVYRNFARQRPMISFWQTNSALNSLPSRVRYMSKYTR